MAERFGTLGSYHAVEIGRAVANDPALMDRMYDRLDRLGLTGDHQRLAGSWSYAGVFADRDQANAAAGMALLLGYGEGDRELTAREQQMAREGGFGILTDAFGGPRPAGIVPGRNTDLDGRVPGYGGAQAEVSTGNLRDPRAQTSSLSGEVADHRSVTSDRYDPTEVDRSHQRHRGDAAAFGHGSMSDVRSQKRDHYAQLLREQAMLPRPYAQIAADEIGGFLTKFSQSGALARAGLSGLAEDGLSSIVGRFGETLKESGDKWEALKAAGSGWQQARDVLIDTRMDQVWGYGLTDEQMAFFRAANESFLPAGIQDMLNTDASRAREQAREALIQVDGETGEHIAELLTRSVISQDDSYLQTIGAYNRANTGNTPVSPPLSQSSVSGGWSGALLDLVATAVEGDFLGRECAGLRPGRLALRPPAGSRLSRRLLVLGRADHGSCGHTGDLPHRGAASDRRRELRCLALPGSPLDLLGSHRRWSPQLLQSADHRPLSLPVRRSRPAPSCPRPGNDVARHERSSRRYPAKG
jgi:conjugal transfer mating pair stabilization protein TraG